MSRRLTLLFAILLLSLPFHGQARDNPFISKKPTKKEVKLPAVATRVFAKIALWQHQLNTKLTKQVKRFKEGRSLKTLFPLILVSFLYGVIHAVGPGHGKVIVFSYFISRRSRIKKGIMLGNLISIFHAVSGVTIVLTLYLIIKTAYLSSFEALSHKIKLVSYSLVVLIGLVLLFKSLFTIRKNTIHDVNRKNPDFSSDRKEILPIALAVGMVPCPGVVIIMLFALSFNLLVLGLMMSFIMALGMASTISIAGLLSILGQEGLLKGFSRKERAQNLIQKGLTVFGSLLIIFFGLILLIGAV